jgi:TolB protein
MFVARFGRPGISCRRRLLSLVRVKRGNRTYAAAAVVALASIAVVVVTLTDDHGSTGPHGAAPVRPAGAQSGAWNVFVVDVRKREPIQLTRNEEEEFTLDPAWRPGTKIAFSQADCEGCPSSLFVISPLSRAAARVRSRLGSFIDPAWAPGGRTLAASKPGFGLYLIDVRSGITRRLTHDRTDGRPTWSADGERVAFERQVSSTNWDIYVTSAVGGKAVPLMRTSAQETSAAWSPDGRWIAFARQGRNGNWTIHVVRPDGTGDHRLTGKGRSSQQPAWSPHGSRIAYVDQAGGGGSVMVMRVAGGRPLRLTTNSMQANRPTWSPDGTRIAFAARR